MSARLSVRPHATIRLPLDGFSRNLIFDNFSKICREIQVSLKSDKNNDYFTCRPVYILIISRSFLLRMRNFSDKSCKENQNTPFFQQLPPLRKSCRLWHNVEKYCRAKLATDNNTAHAHCMLDTYHRTFTHTHYV
jgi:hypothetical protein